MMKRILFYILLITLISTSCGKYGYDFNHNYQSGDSTGNWKDTSMSYIDNSMFDKARIYPGLVGSKVPRVTDTIINLPLNFRWVKTSDLVTSFAPSPMFSTGLYAPAGENIKIIVPQGVIGLTAQIGSHMDDLTGLPTLRRQPIIYTVKELFPGVNYIRNPFGGLLLINASLSSTGDVPIKVTGAVRSPDFIHGVSNQEDWLADVERTEVPWLELRAKRVIFTVPRSFVIMYKDELSVNEILDEWNTIYEKDYYEWIGLKEGESDLRNTFPELPERGVLDIQPKKGAAHSGFPWVATQNKAWFLMFSSYDKLMGSFQVEEGAWGTYHEIGHNYQQVAAWSWGALTETTCNLFVFKAANRYKNDKIASHPALNQAFNKGVEYATSKSEKNFNSLTGISDGLKPFLRITPFLQIFNKAKGVNGESGWDFMKFIYNKARHTNEFMSLEQAKMDFFYRALCEFTGKDFERFMNAWGIPISLRARQDMRLKYRPMNQQIWTYNPLTKTGGDAALTSKYDLNNSIFTYTVSSGVQANDGGGIAALSDGDFNTYMHSCYTNCGSLPGTLPIIIDIDLKVADVFKGLYYANRNHAMTNQRMIISISNDKTNWTQLEDRIDLPTTKGQRIEIEFDRLREARYVRVTFPENNRNNSTFVALAELGLFYNN